MGANFFKPLFCHQWHFTLGGYLAIAIHVCLYSHSCEKSVSDAVPHGQCNSLEMQWLWVGIFTGRVLRERQCTLEGAWYVNIQGMQWECGCKFFKFIIKIDQ